MTGAQRPFFPVGGSDSFSQAQLNIISELSNLTDFQDRRVSLWLRIGKNHRSQSGGFDLDLTYVTARWIVMGFPSQGFQSSYRNLSETTESELSLR
jgi:hypothetical protein